MKKILLAAGALLLAAPITAANAHDGYYYDGYFQRRMDQM
jgi:hypothetical protein